MVKIKHVFVENLFGSHDIGFDVDEKLTFLHGENGVGKTTVFNLIKAALKMDYLTLSGVYFDQIKIYFSNDSAIHLFQYGYSDLGSKPIKQEWPSLYYRICYDEGSENSMQCHLYIKKLSSEFNYNGSAFIRMSRNLVVEGNINHIFKDYINRYCPTFNMRDEESDDILQLHEWIEHEELNLELIKEKLSIVSSRVNILGINRLHSVSFHKTSQTTSHSPQRNRVRRKSEINSNKSFGEAVNIQNLSGVIKDKIKDVEHQVGQEAAMHDQRFISAILKVEDHEQSTVSRDELKSRFESLGNKLKESSRIFIDNDKSELNLSEIKIPDGSNYLFQTLVETLEKKYKKRFAFYNMVLVFEKRLNDLFSGKKIIMTSEGLKVRTKTESNIPITKLSSGEQHQVMITYSLLFEAESHSILLIDEPELSLHPSWQFQFASSMLEINQERGHQFIVATHAPDIVGHEFDRLKSLVRQE